MTTAEGVFPKVGNDPIYSSEINRFAGFGDGSDGDFNESSGTTELTQGTIYQYTSFLLDTSATLSASSTSSKPIIIFVQGDVTINGTINLSGKGATSSYGSALTWGTNGTAGNTNGTGGAGGKKGQSWMNFLLNQKTFIMNGTMGGGGAGADGGGGGGGASVDNDGAVGETGNSTSASGAAGGAGGCTLYMIIGGTLTFGASSSIDVSGADGDDNASGGGGGGGGSGDIIIIHKGTKTDNGVITDVTGGSGGVSSGGGGTGGAGGAGNEKIVSFDTILW